MISQPIKQDSTISQLPSQTFLPQPPGNLTQPANNINKNQTIYINNLNEKVKQDELKKSLYAVFAQFGKIIDILTGSSLKRRGQAFVIFNKIESAEQAITAMQGFPLFNKQMRIQFAHKESDVVAKANGTYVERPKTECKQEKGAANENNLQAANASKKKKKRSSDKSTTEGAAGGGGKKSKPHKSGGGGGHHNGPSSGHHNSTGEAPPFNILFVTMPPGYVVNQAVLESLFSRFPGFCEVRCTPSRPDIAFVEYNSDIDATMAKQALNGYRIEPDCPIKITFSKKS